MAKDYLDFPTLFPEEDEATIRARWNAWANEGISQVSDPAAWTDVREGSFYFVATQSGVQEAARLYDRMNEVAAAAIPLYAWGEYLDDHAESRGLERLAGTMAAGTARFTGEATAVGTIVPAGTTISAIPITTDDDPPSFEVTVGGVIPAGLTVDLPIIALESGAHGNLAAGALTVMETPILKVTVSNLTPTQGGTEPETDEALVERVLQVYEDRGFANVQTYLGWARDYPGVGRAYVLPLALGPGTVLVILTTAEGDQVSAATVAGFQEQVDPAAFTTSLTAEANLPAATLNVASTTGAMDNGYVFLGDAQAVAYTGKTSTTFTGCSGGVGTFPIGSVVEQRGRGEGMAPIGAHVLARTASVLLVDVVAIIEPEPSYSLDGFGGTVALRASINTAITDYVESVAPGSEIVLKQVEAAIATVTGVHDVGSVTIEGAAANFPVPSSPPQVGKLSTLGLTEGSL